jgi:DNA-binding transcriptional regulator YdaS (Cro superfamily)
MNLDHFLATPGTSARLAEQLGVTPGFVSQWRTGHRPVPVEHCAEIERAMGVL